MLKHVFVLYEMAPTSWHLNAIGPGRSTGAPSGSSKSPGCWHAENVVCCAQDLTKDVVRIDAIPQLSLDTIRVRVHTSRCPVT